LPALCVGTSNPFQELCPITQFCPNIGPKPNLNLKAAFGSLFFRQLMGSLQQLLISWCDSGEDERGKRRLEAFGFVHSTVQLIDR
jgi:hypothetical protein